MENTKQLIDRNLREANKAVEDSKRAMNLLKSSDSNDNFGNNTIGINQQVKTVDEQAQLGTELVQVHVDPTTKTFPFGAFIDPYITVDAGGYVKKQSLLDFKTLRKIAKKVEPISAIIKLRSNQVGAFSHVSHDTDGVGFKIMLRNQTKHPTPQELVEMHAIEEFLLNTGFSHNPNRQDNFEAFQRKIVRDRLTLDAISVQLVANKKGELTEFWAMDAGTIFYAVEHYNARRTGTYQPIRYIQERDGQIVGEFTGLEMAYGVANPTTDLENQGYGESEVELLIETVTAYLFARDYNKYFFSKNSVPAGIITLVGKYGEQELQDFKRQWVAQVQGTNNAWRVPIVTAEEGKGATFTPFKTSHKDAEYMNYLEFLIKITAAVYQTSPEEINFAMGSGVQSSPMVAKEGGQAILASKDRGLVPLLRFLENFYNKHLVQRLNPKYKFMFTGTQPEDRQAKADLKNKRSFYLTINELRAEDDLKPIKLKDVEDPMDLPNNPALLQAWQAMQMQKQQEEMQAQQQATGDGEAALAEDEGEPGSTTGGEGAEADAPEVIGEGAPLAKSFMVETSLD